MKIISISGSGGKTTLMKKLAKMYSYKRVLITTSTMIEVPSDVTDRIYTSINDFKRHYVGESGIYAITNKIKNNKFTALKEEEIYDLQRFFDLILIEADGSKKLPLKAWRSFEPVIYSNTYLTIGVMPIDLIGKDFDLDLIFNKDIFLDNYGQRDKFDVNLYADIVNDKDGLFKNATRKILYMSKSDLIEDYKRNEICKKLSSLTGLKVVYDIKDIDIND
ncbi:MAG: selenium cofactor biosynthesis protein YqeC [Tissierellia bacterium]|nr:selenium cofactor biosynthesis protein YqeC [Tissierellia bacterium]